VGVVARCFLWVIINNRKKSLSLDTRGAMNLDAFRETAAFRRFKYQRCVYLIRPKHDDALFGKSACLWLKVGIARTNLWNRLRSYRTYWPGVEILAVATVRQPDDFEGEAIAVVERHVLSRTRRLRPGVESLRHDQAAAVIAAMRSHRFTNEVWVSRSTDEPREHAGEGRRHGVRD
jgi:hypothetical protein